MGTLFLVPQVNPAEIEYQEVMGGCMILKASVVMWQIIYTSMGLAPYAYIQGKKCPSLFTVLAGS